MSGFSYRMSERLAKFIRSTKDNILFPKRVANISKMISKPSYYPELERKSEKEMWKDNFKWLCKHKELNKYYISSGQDIKGLHNADDFLGLHEFIVKRNAGNQAEIHTISGHYNYIALLRDKYAFANYLMSVMGKESVVPVKALVTDGRAFICGENRWTEISELLVDGSSLVYKLVDGECADGVMLVETNNGKISADDKVYTKEEFVRKIKRATYIVQDVVVQHDALKAFKTKSVNTIRIVTVKGKSGKIGVFSAFLRLSASADSFVDNRARGGLGIGIELNTGKLMKYGLPHDNFGSKLEVHPLSGITFEGYQLPYWNEVVELVVNAHKQFYKLQSIGWDVIITENGPTLLEGNDDWEIGGPQDTFGGMRKKWNELVNG